MSAPGQEGTHPAADAGLERASSILLKVGAALTAVFVILPAIGLAAVMVFLATRTTWHGGEGVLATDDQLMLLSIALVAVGFAVTCGVLLRRSLRRGWIALGAVGAGGLACLYAGVRGIAEATGVDGTLAVLSWAVAATGVILVLGAASGMGARLQASRDRPGAT